MGGPGAPHVMAFDRFEDLGSAFLFVLCAMLLIGVLLIMQSQIESLKVDTLNQSLQIESLKVDTLKLILHVMWLEGLAPECVDFLLAQTRDSQCE